MSIETPEGGNVAAQEEFGEWIEADDNPAAVCYRGVDGAPKIYRARIHQQAFDQLFAEHGISTEQEKARIKQEVWDVDGDGFITTTGRFVTRVEAGHILGLSPGQSADSSDL